jgi:hypothetical protein
MPLPPCALVSEAVHVEVGHGVGVVSHRALVVAPGGGCALDVGASLRAREEGRAPPELVALRSELDGRVAAIVGPTGPSALDLPSGTREVRVTAVLRGDRFAAVPFAVHPAVVSRPVAVRVTTQSAWGPHRVAGLARWTDVGTPVVVAVDPARDREAPAATLRLAPGAPVPVLVVDAGPRLASEPVLGAEGARSAALARGGAEALSVLLGDLPLAIATAPDAGASIARLREAARAARAASGASDPLWSAVGQRLATAIATGFTTCQRSPRTTLPARWPSARPELVASGLLDDSDSGCPKVSDLLAVNHPDVRWTEEASAALAAAADLRALPRLGPVERARDAARPAHRRARPIAWVVAATLIGLAAVAVALSREGRAR